MEEPVRRSRGVMWSLIGGSLVCVLALGPAVLFAMMSPMAGDSGVTTATWIFIAAALTFPLALILCPALAWILFARRRERPALVFIFLPLLWPAVLIAAMALASAGLLP